MKDVEVAKPVAHMGLFTSITMIAGVIIGVGIFASPTGAFINIGSVGVTLIMWIVAGVLTMMGAFCYAELGCMMPESGGEHVYLTRAFGPSMAYMFDFTQSLLSYPLSCAAIASMVGQYVVSFQYTDIHIPPEEQLDLSDEPKYAWMAKFVAIGTIWLFCFCNMYSSALGAKLQTILTVIKFGALALISVFGFYHLYLGTTDNFDEPMQGTTRDIGSIGFGLYYLFFSYGGFNNLNYMLGEMKNPEKTLPIAVVISLGAVIVIYLLTNIAYFAAIPADRLMTTKVIGKDFGWIAFGTAGSIIIPVLVVLCASGAVNALAYGNSRLICTFAEEGVILPPFFARLHPTRQTPVAALTLTGVVASLLILAGDFDFLLKMYSFSTWLFYMITVAGLLWLRKKCPEMPRPFRVWTPVAIIFLLVSIYLVVFPFVSVFVSRDPETSILTELTPYMVAAFIALLPLPISYFVKKRRSENDSSVHYSKVSH